MGPEPRTRITLILPVPRSLWEFFTVDEAITDLVRVCGGATTSMLSLDQSGLSTFSGWWNDQGAIVGDANVLIIADAPVDSASKDLQSYLEQLKRDCQHALNQKIIWITLHSIRRISTDDSH